MIASKVNSAIEDGVNRRFFEAIEVLISLGKLSALETFCREAGLTSSRYREARYTYGVTPRTDRVSRYKSIEIEGLYYLVTNYAVSANWLLTGRGKMLRQ